MRTDLRYAIRTLLKNPTFTVVAIATLALGIGANTAIFSVVRGVLLRPLPFPDADRIVQVWTATVNEPQSNHSAGDFLDIQRQNRSFTAIAGYRSAAFTVLASGADPAQLEGYHATVDFFDILGVRPALGRTFSASTDAVPAERLAVLSDSAWQRLFSRRLDAVGQRLKIDGEPFTVAGVLPPGAEWPETGQLWVLARRPVPPSPLPAKNPETDRDIRYFNAIAHLRTDVSLAQARDDMRRVASDLLRQPTNADIQRTIEILPLYDQLVGDVRFGLLVLQSAVALVLLIACANVSSLLIARSTARRRELAIRSALGAGRGRLVRQLLTESVVLGLAGGLAGLLLGMWLTGLLIKILPDAVPRAREISLDRVVAAATVLLGLAASAVFGILPAIQSSRADTGSALKRAGGRGSAASSRGRSTIVVAEIALTLVLLAGAGLLLNSFLRLGRVDSGMRPDDVTVVELMLPTFRYPDGATQEAAYGRLLTALAGQPGLTASGVGFPGPLRGNNASGSFWIEGRAADKTDRPFAHLGSVSGGYFAAMGIPLLAGRTFTDGDSGDAPGVGIVSASLARRYWPGENAVGKHLRFDDDPKEPWMTVVGVVGDVRQLGLEKDAPPILYIPYKQFTLPFTNVAVRSSASPAAVASMVRSALASADPELPPGRISTLQGVLDRSVEQPRFRAMLLASFAVTALVLAAIGLYGLVSYSVTQRTREIGIRMALGASASQVLQPMLREGLVLTVTGVALGLAAAAAATRLLSAFLFGVAPSDPVTLAAVAALLLAVALAASYIPSRRALRVDPIVVLRTE